MTLSDAITPIIFPAKHWCVANFMSTVSELTAEAIVADNYMSEMDAVGAAVASATERIPRLRPQFQIDLVTKARGVFLRKISFQAYDPTLSGSGVQDVDVNAAIEASLSTANDAIMQSRFRNGLVGGWQPNWFRPKIWVNGTNILHSIASGAYGANPADQSIGLSVPYCTEVNLDLGRVTSLEVEAPLFQVVNDGVDDKLQPYAVQCILDLILY